MTEFQLIVEKVLGSYLASHEDSSFGVLTDGSLHFDCWGWMVSYHPPTGLWTFSAGRAGRGVVGQGQSLEEAVVSEKQKCNEVKQNSFPTNCGGTGNTSAMRR